MSQEGVKPAEGVRSPREGLVLSLTRPSKQGIARVAKGDPGDKLAAPACPADPARSQEEGAQGQVAGPLVSDGSKGGGRLGVEDNHSDHSDNSDNSHFGASPRQLELGAQELGAARRGALGIGEERTRGRYFSRSSLLGRSSLNSGAWKGEKVVLTFSGWLVKRGHVRKNWKRRWFLLTNGWLRYYEKEGEEGDPCGVMYLDCNLEPVVADQERKLFRLAFPANGRDLLIAAADDADRDAWVAAIQRSINYAKGLHVPGPDEAAGGKDGEPPRPPPPPTPPCVEWEEDEAYLKQDVKVADLHELVKKLTLPSGPTALFVREFLLTFQLFATPTRLLGLLRERFYLEPDEDWNDEVTQRFVTHTQFPIRLRVFNVLRKWVEMCPRDFDAALLKACLAFLDESQDLIKGNAKSSAGLSKAARGLRDVLSRKLMGLSALDDEEMQDTPHTIVQPQGESTVLDFSNEMIATHLTHSEHAMFRRIVPREFLHKAWTRADKREMAQGVVAMINQFNAMCNCVSVQVLTESTTEQQRILVARFIDIAEHCRALNNFNGVKEIVAGLGHPAVTRLRRVWQGVSKDRMGKFRKLQQLVAEDDHFCALKDALRAVQLPCLPYLGMYLQTLTQIDEVNEDHVGRKVNFAKCRMVARVIMDLCMFQQHPYRASERSPPLFTLLQRWSGDEFDDKKLFDLSFKIEPRSAVVV